MRDRTERVFHADGPLLSSDRRPPSVVQLPLGANRYPTDPQRTRDTRGVVARRYTQGTFEAAVV